MKKFVQRQGELKEMKTDLGRHKRNISTIFALAFLVIVALLFASSKAIAADRIQVIGAGATFPYPIYSKWFDEFHKLHPEIEINYQSIGSGGGIKQVTDKTVDFGASDGPMTDAQLQEFQQKRGVPVLHFPSVLGADVVTYNLPGVNQELKFTRESIADIFLGKIKK